jgi:hypothetical protein
MPYHFLLAPTFNSASASSSAGTLVANEIATYTATYTISQAAGNTGSVKNIATVTGSSPGGNPVMMYLMSVMTAMIVMVIQPMIPQLFLPLRTHL